jgi:hypothetical protein
MTLLEMLGYVAALAMLVNICAVAFVQGTRLTQVGESALLRLDTIADVQKDFREAVRQSVAVEPMLHDFVTGPSQIVLRLPSSTDQPEQTRFIVAGGGNGVPIHITRYSIADGVLALERHKTYPVDFEVVQFTCDRPPGEGTRTVQLDLQLFRDRIDNRSGGGARITATLRADEALL